MPKLKEEIKDEKKGAKHYNALSKKDRDDAPKFKSMAKDEKKHKGMLEKIEKGKIRVDKGGYVHKK